MEDYKKIAIELGKTLISKAPETREDVERMLPELREESEDERIRWEIVEHINNMKALIVNSLREHQFNSWLAWLEKQGEQKPQRMVSAEAKEAMYGKPAWSEEDERMLDKCIKAACSNYYPGISSVRDWLRGIKDRVLQQPKQEWSEEDEKHIDTITSLLEDRKKEQTDWGVEVLNEEIAWLKSLRPQSTCTYNPYKAVVESIAEMCKHYDKATDLQDFYDNVKVKCKDAKEYDSLYPQPQWKPSEEQLKSLKEVIDVGHFTSYPNALETLYEQLKKLREE